MFSFGMIFIRSKLLIRTLIIGSIMPTLKNYWLKLIIQSLFGINTYSTDDDGLIGCKASTLCYDSLPSGESVSIMVRGCIKGIFKIREFWKRVYLNEDANEVFESYREKMEGEK